MVRPVSLQGFQKGFQGVSLRGFRGFQIFLWEFMCLYQIPQLRGSLLRYSRVPCGYYASHGIGCGLGDGKEEHPQEAAARL